MDIALINTNTPAVTIPAKSNDQIADTASAIIENKAADSFDYSKVMMNLEEIQDFLFLLIGSENPARHGKGSNINFLA